MTGISPPARNGANYTIYCPLSATSGVTWMRSGCEDCRREVPLEDFDIDAIVSGTAEPEAVSMLDRQWAEACHAAARRHVLEKFPLDPVHRQVFLDLERGMPIAAVAYFCRPRLSTQSWPATPEGMD